MSTHHYVCNICLLLVNAPSKRDSVHFSLACSDISPTLHANYVVGIFYRQLLPSLMPRLAELL